jgi:pimeloyl-ACP methyl ester carboxylesterase
VQIVDKGSGTPLVLIPPLQGRWEYMSGTVDALARSFRVITFSLCGERGSGVAFDPSRGLGNYVSQALSALDRSGIDRAIVCGVSFGGVVALRFAVEYADRTAALILASTPGPRFHLRRRHEIYARAPFLFGPLFFVELPRRVRPEFRAALPDPKERRRFALRQVRTFFRAPISLRKMGIRARMISALDLGDLCGRVAAPTLIVTGERELDFVVPVQGSTDYVRLIPGARSAVLERTGHHGTITKPDSFAKIVREFADEHRHAAA